MFFLLKQADLHAVALFPKVRAFKKVKDRGVVGTKGILIGLSHGSPQKVVGSQAGVSGYAWDGEEATGPRWQRKQWQSSLQVSGTDQPCDKGACMHSSAQPTLLCTGA